MADSSTNNIQLLLMQTGTASGTWGAVLNTQNFTPLDAILGASLGVALSSSDVNLTRSQRQHLGFALTGVLTADVTITIPLSPNSATVAEGGFFIFDNRTTGNFVVTVKTIAAGSTGVQVPQGLRALLWSDGTDVAYADDTQNAILTVAGDPNGSVAGTTGSAATRQSVVVNRGTNEEYICTTSGNAAAAVWSKNLPYGFEPQGYLTANSSSLNVVQNSDALASTSIYYTAFRGNQFFVFDGTSFFPVTITSNQMQLNLTAAKQVANKIYDVMGFLDSTGTVRIAFSPAWDVATAGAGSRGTGAGTPQLTRIKGLLVNAVSQSVNSGATTYTVAAQRGTYLGSIFVDGTAGQVTCHVNYGQNRKWGIWNAYNRLPIYLKAGDTTASWTTATVYPTFRASDNDTTNNIVAFTGLPEEWIFADFIQKVGSRDSSQGYIGIGLNSASAASGTVGTNSYNDAGVNYTTIEARFRLAPDIGINNLRALESSTNSHAGGAVTLYGTQAFMLLSAQYNG